MSSTQQVISTVNDVSKNIKIQSKWAFEINLGALECEGTTPCEEWTIEMPLLGNYVSPDLATFEQVLSRIDNFVLKNDLPFGKNNKDGPGSYTRTAGSVYVYCFPKLAVESKEMEAIIVSGMGYWSYDDITEMSTENKTSLLANKAVTDVNTTFRSIFKGAYPNVTDIPETRPELRAFYFCLHHTWKLLVEALPNFVDNVEPFLLSNEQWVKVASLMLRENYNDNISMETYRIIRAFDVGFIPLFELGILANRVEVSPALRQNYLYELILTLMGAVVGFTNDIFSLARDISRGNRLNYVRLLSRDLGLTLKVAVLRTVSTIENQMNDIELACTQLCEEFDNDPDVQLVIATMKNTFNGCLIYYIHTARYGNKVCSKPYIKNNLI